MRTAMLPAVLLVGLLFGGCRDLGPVQASPDGTVRGEALRGHVPGASVPLHLWAASTDTWVRVLVVDDFLGPDPDDRPDRLTVGVGLAFWLLQQGAVVPHDFEGRCTRPSLWVFGFVARGTATHAGRLESVGSHCTYPPTATEPLPTYGDGEVVSVSAAGDELWFHYTNGSSGLTQDPTVVTFRDDVTVVGGTGRFGNAGGGGTETGLFDLVTGQFELEIVGYISHDASERSR